ncbi:MAG: hypothetical protein ACK4M6_03665 [Hyphomonas sp.]
MAGLKLQRRFRFGEGLINQAERGFILAAHRLGEQRAGAEGIGVGGLLTPRLGKGPVILARPESLLSGAKLGRGRQGCQHGKSKQNQAADMHIS